MLNKQLNHSIMEILTVPGDTLILGYKIEGVGLLRLELWKGSQGEQCDRQREQHKQRRSQCPMSGSRAGHMKPARDRKDHG